MELSYRRNERGAGDNRDFAMLHASESIEPIAELNLFAHEEFLVETSDLTENICIAKDERAGSPTFQPADQIPEPDQNAYNQDRLIRAHGRASSDANTGFDLTHDRAE